MRPLAGLVLVLAATSHAQTPAEALKGSTATITAKELPDAYRPVALGSSDGGFGGFGIYALAGIGSGGEGGEAKRSSMLFSLMGITFVDPDEFSALLDGKRARIKGYAMDLASLLRSAKAGERATPAPVFTETWIEGGRVAQWSPRPALSKAAILATFGAAEDGVADKAKALSNVKQVALGFILYASDYDDHFPKADSTAKAKTLVMPYVKSQEIWTTANGRILYNTSLSGIADTSIESPASTVLVWEEQPASDGMRAVGFADGHAKRVSQAEWDRLWAAELARRKVGKKG